ncbi:MAG: J domain-containing protein [Desulfotignum sp.]|nr:J domain-containing protein [Desulfotignum sp.]MCF8088677.1 J domain-containing protein [Desulfotignum sp.]MCF8136407.1 J domain-containing protein [Desulfotignum sp.]
MEIMFDTQGVTRYKIGMDIQNALKLLDLEPGATLEDARDAFKKKAKQFHPDKLMAASGNKDDGEKMKDINVAYHTLTAVLKPGNRKKPVHLLPEQFSPACRRLVDTVRKWISERRHPSRSSTHARPKTAPPRTRRNPSPGAFEDVLKQSMRRRMAGEKRYTAYARYLELERKMNQARQQNPGPGWEVDSVEPISRIKPVK